MKPILLTLLTGPSRRTPEPAIAHEEHGKSQYGGVVAEGRKPPPGRARREAGPTDALHHRARQAAADGRRLGKTDAARRQSKDGSELLAAGDNRFEAKGNFNIEGARWSPPFRCPAGLRRSLRFARQISRRKAPT